MDLTPDSDDPPPEVTWAVRLQASRLVVREPNKREVPYPLDGKAFRLGRAEDNRIIVKAEFVAAHQLRFEPTGVGDGYRVRDLGGPCSLMFNGHQVPEHELRHGDVLRVGDPYTGSFVTITYQRLARTLAPSDDQQVPRCRLDLPEVTIGREGCELTLASLLVSRRHATVRALPDGHEVRDLNSANGTFVNGERVQQSKKLSRGDIIQVGPFKLVYDGRSLDSYDHRGAIELKARRLMRVVGGGKVILDRVSLAIQPREFVAIVGGSGAGKSTLLGALSGFSRASEGDVLVNGDDYYANFAAYRGSIGYVPQSDILHQTLTVDEALRFTAQLRLPEDTGDAEIAARVERVLADVDIEDRRTTRISQLSGGQRKRVSIAAELLADPSLFFLDEPTSGLDPGLEKRLMYTLRRLADGGRTIVMVTHATANIHQCDHIAFMSDGRLVWFGPPADALQHFGVRSGDFADIYTKVDGDAHESHPLVQGELRTEYARWREAHERGEPSLAELWELRYRRSDARTRYIVERLAGGTRAPAVKPSKMTTSQQNRSSTSLTSMRVGAVTPEDRPEPARVSAWQQWLILVRRNIRLLAVDQRNLATLLLQAPIIGAILVLVARPTALQDLQSSHGRLVLFLVALVAVWCGILCSARELTKERAIYRRERLANLRIGPYLLAKFVVLAAICLVQSVVLLSVLAIKVDFSAAVTTFTATGPVAVVRGVAGLGFFGGLLVTTFLSSLSGLGMGLLLSSTSSTSDRAMSVVPLVLVPQLLLALALVSLPAGLAPLSYVTSARWAMEAFGSLAHLQPPRDFAACTIPGNPLSCPIYPTVDYDPSTAHVIEVWGVLLAYTALCVAVAAVVLARRDRERER
ncbi:ATP-binding cassette domain-containing protein [Nannocystis radixulma]|uniref:ATP-binding cassette domain-containing protein n=1 Tax=Nannocystis radixulma TaxID=2995305 RepID=A0ABT5BAM8_9BACT|nr:ATP-binding cassette domain-containing protein [Nannocystis radixulma]MDC0670788.1 ATP-binding cassette domain-containing protein [Nannocystis radixulma]